MLNSIVRWTWIRMANTEFEILLNILCKYMENVSFCRYIIIFICCKIDITIKASIIQNLIQAYEKKG